MLAVDSSSLIAFLQGDPRARDIALIRDALDARALVLPPVVVTESLSNDVTALAFRSLAFGVPVLVIAPGYWERAGASRAAVLQRGHKAALADTLIAQACIDADVALITRDKDFRHFEKHCGLKLA